MSPAGLRAEEIREITRDLIVALRIADVDIPPGLSFEDLVHVGVDGHDVAGFKREQGDAI